MAIADPSNVLSLLARELNIAVADLRPDKLLKEDLGLDSIIALNLIFAVERELGFTIKEDDIVTLRTVSDLQKMFDHLSKT